MAHPGSTFDCGSRIHSFLLLYYLAVLLLVILPGSLFDCGTSWNSFQFDIPSQSFRVQQSLLIVVLADSPFDFDTSAKVKIIAKECSTVRRAQVKSNVWAEEFRGPKWFWAEMTRNSATRSDF